MDIDTNFTDLYAITCFSNVTDLQSIYLLFVFGKVVCITTPQNDVTLFAWIFTELTSSDAEA